MGELDPYFLFMKNKMRKGEFCFETLFPLIKDENNLLSLLPKDILDMLRRYDVFIQIPKLKSDSILSLFRHDCFFCSTEVSFRDFTYTRCEIERCEFEFIICPSCLLKNTILGLNNNICIWCLSKDSCDLLHKTRSLQSVGMDLSTDINRGDFAEVKKRFTSLPADIKENFISGFFSKSKILPLYLLNEIYLFMLICRISLFIPLAILLALILGGLYIAKKIDLSRIKQLDEKTLIEYIHREILGRKIYIGKALKIFIFPRTINAVLSFAIVDLGVNLYYSKIPKFSCIILLANLFVKMKSK